MMNFILQVMKAQVSLTLQLGKIIHEKLGKYVIINPSTKTDEVQKNKRNEPDLYITKWWQPKTSLYDGITKVFEAMRSNYEV